MRVCLVVFMVLGCGGSLCDRLVTMPSAVTMQGTCDQARVALKVVNINRSTCDAHLAPCTAADTRQLNAFVDCINALGVCRSGREGDYLARFQVCTTGISLSAECTAGVNALAQ